jgi:ABC-type Fe3+ transport system permease subunit
MVRCIGLACSTLYFSVLVRGLWVARSLFKRLADGMVFEPETGVLLRRFGIALVVYAALTPFVGTLMAWLVTMLNPPGERLLRFAISDHEIVLAIVGTLILTTGSVMADAARMAEESRQII